MVRFALCPGHGFGRSPSGCVVGAGTEREWVLDFARDVIAFAPQWTYRLLRTEPKGVSYSDRAAVADGWEADLVLCLHANSYIDPSLEGLLCLYDFEDTAAGEVGAAIMRAAPAGLRRRNTDPYPTSPDNWTRRAHAVMLPYRQVGLSVVLVEVGFASASRDLDILLCPESRPALCASIVCGLTRRIELA